MSRDYHDARESKDTLEKPFENPGTKKSKEPRNDARSFLDLFPFTKRTGIGVKLLAAGSSLNGLSVKIFF